MAIQVEYQYSVFLDGVKIKGVGGTTTKNTEVEIIDRVVEVINLDHYGLKKSDITSNDKQIQKGYWRITAEKGQYSFTLQLNIKSR